MPDKINIGVIGCANVAERFILPILSKRNGDYNFLGIASRTKEKASIFAEKFNTKYFVGYENLLAEKKLDAVYIPLPNSLHYEWVKKALLRGVHVLVEKSLACSYAEVFELNDLAQSRGLALVESFQFRFHSQLKYIMDTVQSGVIGEIRNISSCFGFPLFRSKANIRYQKDLGGGALLDVGAYPIKISQLLLGEDIEVLASSLHYDKEYEVDTWGSAYLKQKGGSVSSQISFGFDNYYQCNFELWGSKGKLHAHRVFTAGPEIKPDISVETREGLKEMILEQDNHFQGMLQHFYSQIQHREKRENEFRSNINQARLIEDVRVKANEL